MKIAQLAIVKQPQPVAKKVCLACKAFVAECLVPVGDGAMQMCWLCAHQVIEHDAPLHTAHSAECACRRDEIYPKAVLVGMSALGLISTVAEDAPRS